ncbi:MAG TPA: hypothetical protein VJA85_03500 [Candidatus Limnocylindria bacterium]|nr:hypothetical protein [Candidatus Limnocylindria bacterium]
MSAGQALALVRRAFIVAAVVLALAVNVVGLATIVIDHQRAFDWDNYVEAARRFPLGTLYDWQYPYGYHYAPQLAPVLGVLTAAGITIWRLAHFVALALLPSRKLALLLLVSYPFWFDVNAGNLMMFVFLAAAWALRGNAIAVAAYLVLCALIPRPIMLPLLAWILWQRPAWRWPFVGIVALVVASAVPTGYLGDWVASFNASGVKDIANDFNLSPSRFVGPWWLLVGIPLGVWLTLRGRIGWASMAISPYLLPYWVQMLGLELVRPRDERAAAPYRSAATTIGPERG